MRLTEDNIHDSSIKLDTPFNNCQGGEFIKKWLDKEVVVYDVVDLDGIEYWENEADTLVIAFLGIDERALTIGKMSADEFDWVFIPVVGGKMTVIRLWWD
jgi:hypothetical protein